MVFRDITNLDEVLLSYSVAPMHPGVLCMGESANTLLFANVSKRTREVRRLDCSKLEPVLCDELTKIASKRSCVNFILAAGHTSTKLLLVAGLTCVDAYKPNSSEVAWSNEHGACMEMDFRPHSLSTDEHGHLYVVDYDNDCVLMFSIEEGSHMGVVLSEEQGLDDFREISWCGQIASLAVFCKKDGETCIALCKIDHDDDK